MFQPIFLSAQAPFLTAVGRSAHRFVGYPPQVMDFETAVSMRVKLVIVNINSFLRTQYMNKKTSEAIDSLFQ
jgi:hypothetical protein